MTTVMEREPLMTPTIVRRVAPDGVLLMERVVENCPEGPAKAVCVFWSAEHARRVMYANGCYPEDGWRAIELAARDLALVFDWLNRLEGELPRFVYVEPAPGAPELRALMRPEEFIAMLEECDREGDTDV